MLTLINRFSKYSIVIFGFLAITLSYAQDERAEDISILDVDANGEVDALTDGLLLLRSMFELTDDALVTGVVDSANCKECDAEGIDSYITSIKGTTYGGLTPDAGPAGPQGEKGDKGDTGAMGDTGPAGPQGEIGDKGDTGAKGDTGSQGIAGVKGDAGADGSDGAKGDTGATGVAGPQGATGAQGAAGTSGGMVANFTLSYWTDLNNGSGAVTGAGFPVAGASIVRSVELAGNGNGKEGWPILPHGVGANYNVFGSSLGYWDGGTLQLSGGPTSNTGGALLPNKSTYGSYMIYDCSIVGVSVNYSHEIFSSFGGYGGDVQILVVNYGQGNSAVNFASYLIDPGAPTNTIPQITGQPYSDSIPRPAVPIPASQHISVFAGDYVGIAVAPAGPAIGVGDRGPELAVQGTLYFKC